MKEKREYKMERGPRWKGIGELRENIVIIRTALVINFKNYIQELIFSDCAENDFL